MPIPQTPPKVDPDESKTSELTTLNEFKTYLSAHRHAKDATYKDALKVIDCLRFVKVNKEFIIHAITYPNDKAVYQGGKLGDQDSRLLRDFKGTSFHFASYDEKQGEAYWNAISNLVNQVEKAYQHMKTQNQLPGFVMAFLWDEDVGCLEARTSGALKYAANLLSNPLVSIKNKVQEAAHAVASQREDGEDSQRTYGRIFDYLDQENQFGNLVLCPDDEKSPIVLTRHLLAQHLPQHYRSLYPEEKAPAVDAKTYLPTLDSQALTAELAIKVINQGNGLVKTVASPANDNQHWDFLFKQLKNPEKERPFLPLPISLDQTKVFNPKTRQTITRTRTTSRGAPKATPFIKKTAATLLPADGKMILYGQGVENVGILWDVNYCHLKSEKYTFRKNVGSDGLKKKLWVGAPQSVGIDQLRQQNERAREAWTTREHNEILASPSKQAVRAIFATADNLDARLNALRIQQYIAKDEIGLTLPLLIQTSTRPIKEYSLEQQIKDIDVLRQSRFLSAADRQLIKDFYSPHVGVLSENVPRKLLCSYLDYALTLPVQEKVAILASEHIAPYLDLRTVDERGANLLHQAAEAGQSNIIKFLIEKHSANIHMRDNEGNTPLHYACKASPRAAKILMAYGADLNAVNHNGKRARDNITEYQLPYRTVLWPRYAIRKLTRRERWLGTLMLISSIFIFTLAIFQPLTLVIIVLSLLFIKTGLELLFPFLQAGASVFCGWVANKRLDLEVALLPAYNKWCQFKIWLSNRPTEVNHIPITAANIKTPLLSSTAKNLQVFEGGEEKRSVSPHTASSEHKENMIKGDLSNGVLFFTPLLDDSKPDRPAHDKEQEAIISASVPCASPYGSVSASL